MSRPDSGDLAANVDLSVTEIAQLAQRALTGSGVPVGLAQSAARMITWAEILRGSGLYELQSRLRAIDEIALARFTTHLDGVLKPPDGGGLGALALGPIALDLASALARGGRSGWVAVPDVTRSDLLIELVVRGAQRGFLTAAGVHAPSRGIHSPECGAPCSKVLLMSPYGEALHEVSLRATYCLQAYHGAQRDGCHMLATALFDLAPVSDECGRAGYFIACFDSAANGGTDPNGTLRLVLRAKASSPMMRDAWMGAVACRKTLDLASRSRLPRQLWMELLAAADRVLIADSPESDASRRHLMGTP